MSKREYTLVLHLWGPKQRQLKNIATWIRKYVEAWTRDVDGMKKVEWAVTAKGKKGSGGKEI